MSTTHVRLALDTPDALSPVERLVLIQLGDFAGQDGIAFPAVSRVAAAANISYSTAARVLRRLEDRWLIVRAVPRTSPNAPVAYRVLGGRA